jgi:putative hydrolase of the HAD superfamily
MNHPGALILDYGGVLSLPQDADSVEQMVAHLGVDGERFRKAYRQDRPAFDRGAASGEQYWRGVVSKCGLDPAVVDLGALIELDVQSWTQVNDEMVRLVAELRPRLDRLAIISNMTANTLVAMRRDFEWLALFDECVYSCEIGSNKPERAIYETCLRRLNLCADECLFVDDSAKNVLGARAVGMSAIRFEAMEPFLAELAAFGLVR